MGQGRFISYLGILISLNVALWTKVNVWWIFALSNLGWILLCVGLTYVEYRLANMNKKWIDKPLFWLAKNPNDYVIKEKIIEYTLSNTSNAQYSEKVTIKSKREGHITYHGKYSWPDQEEEINLVCPYRDSVLTDENTKWTKVDITSESFLEKNKIWTTGFNLTNLQMKKYKKRSFLSVKTTDKMEKVVLRVKIGEEMPKVKKEATLRVENGQGRTISEEPVEFNKELNALEKELICLRLGRKYILEWDYEKYPSNY